MNAELKCSDTENAVSVRELSLSFGDNQVLDKVSFEIPVGEIFGLLGPSGAGKTTLIKILTGQLKPDAGCALLLGRDTRELRAAEHKRIGMMMDNFGLYERLSVMSNLSFYADIYHVSRSKIVDILKSIGLYEARNTPAAKLSKGMKSRLSLARALMNDAKILFLDEPTSGLDPVTTREIHGVLKAQKERGATIFLTTHNMYEAEALCGHVALLSRGHILEYGAPEDVRRKYNHLNRLQITLKSGRQLSLENGGASALQVKEYLEQDAIWSIHSTEPTLETVFIELTGEGLGVCADNSGI